MLLEPGGFITPHVDTFDSKLSPINMALNHPKGCAMKMKGHSGFVPFKLLDQAMLLDVGNTHAYIIKVISIDIIYSFMELEQRNMKS